MSMAPNPFAGGLTAAQAQARVSAALKKKQGFTRAIRPQLPEMKPLYIYSVSDNGIFKTMADGTYGWTQPGFPWFYVPPCAEDAEHSEPVFYYEDGKKREGIPGLMQFEHVKSIDIGSEWAIHKAEELGAEIMRMGPGKPPQDGLDNYGLFMSWHNPPLPAEVKAAQQKLTTTLERLMKEGNLIYAQGEKKGLDGQMLGNEHFWAAQLLGQQEPWARGARKMLPCPHCGSDMPANAAVHYGPGGCGGVIDWPRAIEASLKTMAQWMEASPMLPKDKRHPDYEEPKKGKKGE